MKMWPFISFYGGKWRLAPRYPAPQHDTIVEPFAGSAGYATRYYDRKVILVERDPIIASIWQYIIGTSSAEIRSLPILPLDGTVDDLHCCQEAKWLIGFWLNKATMSPCRRPSKWMRTGRYDTSFWCEKIRERVAVQADLIRHWKIIHGSYGDAPFTAATWFIDPPYARAGTHYKFGSKLIDYSDLGLWCRVLPGQVLVCENEGADWLPFQAFHTAKSNPSIRGKGYSVEVLWTNT